MTIKQYLDQYQTANYYIGINKEHTKYMLVNKTTGLEELKSSMLPQVIVNMYNFEDALKEINDELPSPSGSDNVVGFKSH